MGVLVESLATEMRAQGREVEVWIPHDITGYEIPEYVHSLHFETQRYIDKQAVVEGVDLPLSFPAPKSEQLWPKIFQDFQQTKTAPRPLYHPVTGPGDFMAFAHAVRDRMKNEPKNTMIIGMDYHQVPSMMMIKKEFPDIKQIFYVNSIEQDRKAGKVNNKKSRTFIRLENLGFTIADTSVVVSQITKDLVLKEHQDVKPSSISVVNNDLEFDPEIIPHHQINTGKNILFIGRVSTHKGLHFLMDAAEQITDIDNQIRIIIAGDGPLLPELIEIVARRGLERSLIFTGFVNTEEKKLLYRSSDLFVMPSPSEPFGLTALEAIRSGVPVIASTKCGFTGVVPSTPTFRYHDTGKFMELMLFYMNNPGERVSLLKQQKRDLQDHSWEKEVAGLMKVIDKIK